MNRSEAARLRWQKPEYRDKQRQAQEARWTPEVRQRQSEVMSDVWQRSDYRQRQQELGEVRYTDEVREKISEARRRNWEDPSYREAIISQKFTEFHYHSDGYRILHGKHGHPLADDGGHVAEHRVVLYDKIGPGPHPCHWGCGRILDWGTVHGIQADHVDFDVLNNDPDNLVPSCLICNWNRK